MCPMDCDMCTEEAKVLIRVDDIGLSPKQLLQSEIGVWIKMLSSVKLNLAGEWKFSGCVNDANLCRYFISWLFTPLFV